MNIPKPGASVQIIDPTTYSSQLPVQALQPVAAAQAKPTSTETVVRRTESEKRQELETALAAANQKLAGDGHEVQFEYDRDASRLIVRLVDTSTREILRQFPSDDALRVARQIKSGNPLISMRA